MTHATVVSEKTVERPVPPFVVVQTTLFGRKSCLRKKQLYFIANIA